MSPRAIVDVVVDMVRRRDGERLGRREDDEDGAGVRRRGVRQKVRQRQLIS